MSFAGETLEPRAPGPDRGASARAIGTHAAVPAFADTIRGADASLATSRVSDRAEPLRGLSSGSAAQAACSGSAGKRGRHRVAILSALALPDRLGGVEEGVLHLPEKPLQTPAGVLSLHQLIGEGAGMAEIHQQSHLVGREADQMFVVAVGDLHAASQGTFLF